MQSSVRDNGPDTVLEDGVPQAGAIAPLLRRHQFTVLAAGAVLLAVVMALGWYAYQRQRTQLQNTLHEQGQLTQQALEMRLDMVRKHVAGMRYAMERSLRWPVLADSSFLDRVQQRNLSPLRDAPWERLPIELVRETGSLQLDPDAALDGPTLRRDLGAVSAMLPAVVALHTSTPTLWSSYYLDAAQRWRLAYPPQGRDERLQASASTDMRGALHNLWPGSAIAPQALTRAATEAQRTSVWTPPFASSKGLGMALLAPVMNGPEQVGVVGTDVGLDLLDYVLVQHAPSLGRALVVNADGLVLGDSGGALTKATAPLRLADVVPDAGTPWREGATDPAWQRLTLRGADLFLLLHQPPASLRSAALGALTPYAALSLVLLAALGGLVVWQSRHYTQPALQLVQYQQQLEQSPQRKAPPAPPLWAPWFTQVAQAARERHTLLDATLRHARQQQGAQDAHQAALDQSATALTRAQAQLQSCQQQLVRAERMAALGPIVAKGTQALTPLLAQAQQTAASLHSQNELLQQGLLHGASLTELQRDAAALDQVTLALTQQLQAMAPLLAGLRQASTDPLREVPRAFRLHDLANQVMAQLPAAARREGIHIANGIARELELHTRASACGQVLGQLLAQTVAQAFTGRSEGIIRLSAKSSRLEDGTDVLVLQVHDTGASHPAVLPEHTQRALVQGALGGRLDHHAEDGANVCSLHLAQHLDAVTSAPPATPAEPQAPALPELPTA
ncbi:MAG: HAMP domain-containing histidine kinase [Rhodoferax sp.]|nr:MAG: HAMP domain-containing histidine kinase [Rhodoferax sp.]